MVSAVPIDLITDSDFAIWEQIMNLPEIRRLPLAVLSEDGRQAYGPSLNQHFTG